MPTTITELNQPTHTIQWCPGCGDYGILQAIKNAIVELGLKPKDVVVASGVGCSSKLPHYIKTYGFEGLHGRGLPAATGTKLSNPDLTVIAVGGDGDGYGIGIGHFIHSVRRNIDMTYIVHNNQVYGLTTGQASPTTAKGTPTKSTPFGVIEPPINPLSLALSANGTFIARTFAGDLKYTTEIIKKSIEHKGFGFVDCLQPCVSFNKVNTHQYYQERCYKLEEAKHDASNFEKAMQKAIEWNGEDKKIPTGVFYQTQRPTYEDELPQIKGKPAAKQPIDGIDIAPLFEEFA